MKNKLFTCLLLVYTCQAMAQTDALPLKKPADEQYRVGDITAFRAGKKWGAYNHKTKKLVSEPVYLFTCAIPYGYLAVDKSSIHLLSTDGKIMKSTTSAMLGTAGPYAGDLANRVIFTNTRVFSATVVTDGSNAELIPGNTTEELCPEDIRGYPEFYSIERWNQVLLVNRVKVTKSDEPYYRMYDGIRFDSIDVNGNLVYHPVDSLIRSGVYNAKTKTWPLHCKTGSYYSAGKNKLIQKDFPFKTDALQYTVFNKDMQKVFSYTAINSQFTAEAIQQLAPFDRIDDLKRVDSINPNRQHYYLLTQDRKIGVFVPSTLKMETEAEYDHVFIFKSHQHTVFEKQGKLSMYLPYFNGRLALDTHLVNFISTPDEFDGGYKEMAELNGRYFKLNSNGTIEEGDREEASFCTKWLGSCVVKNNCAYVNDYQPLIKSRPHQWYIDGVFLDSTDFEGNIVYDPPVPEVCNSGVFNLITNKWILPRMFTACYPVGSYSAGIRRNGPVNFYTFAGSDGKILAENVTIDKIAADKNLLSQLLGKTVTNAKPLGCDTNLLDLDFCSDLVVYTTQGSGVFTLDKMTWRVEPTYEDIVLHEKGYSFITFSNGKAGIVAFNGQPRCEPRFSEMEYDVNGGFYICDKAWCIKTYDVPVLSSEIVPASQVSVYITPENMVRPIRTETGYYFLNVKAAPASFKMAEYHYNRIETEMVTYDEYGEPYYQYDENGNPALNVSETKIARTHFYESGKVIYECDTLAWMDGEWYLCNNQKYVWIKNGKPYYQSKTEPVITGNLVGFEQEGLCPLPADGFDEMGEPTQIVVNEKFYWLYNQQGPLQLPDKQSCYNLINDHYLLSYTLERPDGGDIYTVQHVYLRNVQNGKTWKLGSNPKDTYAVYRVGNSQSVAYKPYTSSAGRVCLLRAQPENDTLVMLDSANVVNTYGRNLILFQKESGQSFLYNENGKLMASGRLELGEPTGNRLLLYDDGEVYLLDEWGEKINHTSYAQINMVSVRAGDFDSFLLTVKTQSRSQVVDMDGNVLMDGDGNTEYTFNWPEQYSQRVWEIHNGVTSTYFEYNNGWKPFKITE